MSLCWWRSPPVVQSPLPFFLRLADKTCWRRKELAYLFHKKVKCALHWRQKEKINACFWNLPLLYILVEKNLNYSGRGQNPTAYHFQNLWKQHSWVVTAHFQLRFSLQPEKQSDPSFFCKALLYKWENVWRPKTPLRGDIKQICNLTNKQL